MESNTSKIGIYEPNADGHRFKYVQYLISEASRKYQKIVLITTQEALNHPNYDLHLAHLKSQFTIHLITNTEPKNVTKLTRHLSTDIMVLPDGDAFVWKEAWKLGQKRHGSISAVIMRLSSSSGPATERVLKNVAKQLLMKLANIHVDVRAIPLKSSLWTPSKKKIGVPDPISFNPDRRAPNKIENAIISNPHKKWLGIVGALSARKNIELVLNSAQSTKRTDFGIILAGHIDPAIRKTVQTAVAKVQEKGIDVIVCDAFLTDGELDAILQRLHCVILAHSNEGPSGILGKSVEAGTFILAAGAKSLRDDCRLIPDASYWAPLNQKDLADAINIALMSSTPVPKNLSTESIFTDSLLRVT